MRRTAQTQPSARAKPRRDRGIGFIVASALLCASVYAVDSPREFARRVADREARTEAARAHYAYRQSVTIQELNDRGTLTGEYREVRDVIFSPTGERTEKLLEAPRSTLRRLRLTEEDFRDLREIQPLLLLPDQLWNYDVKSRGSETVEGVECEVFEVRPRQVLQGQRLFDGLVWVDAKDLSVVRMEGQAVPQIRGASRENLFPRFTTVRAKVGEHWFPQLTTADDTLDFRTGPQRIRMVIRYSNYQRFGAESRILPE